MRQLLSVPGGDAGSAEEVGEASPGCLLAYGTPDRSNAQCWEKATEKEAPPVSEAASQELALPQEHEARRPNRKVKGMDATTPQRLTAVYVYATREDPPGNLAEQLLSCLEQATKQENQRVATYVDIQPGYRYNLKDALAYAVHFVFEQGESIALAETFVRLLRSDRHINELLFELERQGIDPWSILDKRIPQKEKVVQIMRACAQQPGEH